MRNALRHMRESQAGTQEAIRKLLGITQVQHDWITRPEDGEA